MTIKLNTLNRWNPLPSGNAIMFDGPADVGRRVRLLLNCSGPTVLNIEDEDGPRLLCALPAGIETVEFSHSGKFAVFADKEAGELHYQTAEMEPTFTEAVDPVNFTRILERRVRDPHYEAIQQAMFINQQRNMTAMAEQIRADLMREMKATANVRPVESAPVETGRPAGTADGAGGGAKPAPDGSGVAPSPEGGGTVDGE